MFQFLDYSQMFDSIDLRLFISDLCDTCFSDDNLALIYQANKKINMGVKTTYGMSERQVIENTVLHF